MGYLLSNGATGVYFNDSTKIVLDVDGEIFDYIERRSSDKQEVIASHTVIDYPPELHKKVTLLQHFKAYLEGDGKKPIVAPVKQDSSFTKLKNNGAGKENRRI